MKLIKNGNIRGIDMTEQDLKIQELKEENKKLKEEIQKYKQSMERILTRLEELKNAPKRECSWNNGWTECARCAIREVKEEGGIE